MVALTAVAEDFGGLIGVSKQLFEGTFLERMALEWGRVLGLVDARHVWASVLDDDGLWKRIDPLLELHCERVLGASTPAGAFFRGGVPNALPAWPGSVGMLLAHTPDGPVEIDHIFAARKVA